MIPLSYDSFMETSKAENQIKTYLADLKEVPETLAGYEALSNHIMGIIESKDIPAMLVEVICHAYEELNRKCDFKGEGLPVAVRSSGVAEDMPEASFAGQYDSYLNVIGEEELLRKIRSCWASMFTARCISYRLRKSLPILAGSISVAVQKMVNVRSAGVGFTVCPDTGNELRIVLEGNWGVGESVVQGIVSPDRYTINKENLQIEEKKIPKKERMISLKTRGTEEEEIPSEYQSLPCLSDEEAIRIAELARDVESHFGKPQDIEWVLDSEIPFPQNVFLVQARPITAIAEKKSPVDEIYDRWLGRL
jgi:pyruvate,water dikinase